MLYYACEKNNNGREFLTWCKPMGVNHARDKFVEERPRHSAEDQSVIGRVIKLETELMNKKLEAELEAVTMMMTAGFIVSLLGHVSTLCLDYETKGFIVQWMLL